MYNSPPNMIPGHGPVPPGVYPAQRPYMQPPQYFQVNGPRPINPQYNNHNGPPPSLQHSSSISSTTESNTSPPSVTVTPGPDKPILRQPTQTVYYCQPPPRPQQFVQGMQPRPQVMSMMPRASPVFRYQAMQYMPMMAQRPPFQPNQSFSIGYFQAPPQGQDSHFDGGQKSGSRGKRGKNNDPKRNTKNDGQKQETKTSSGSSPDGVKPPLMEQPPPPQQPMMVQNPMFVYPPDHMQMAPQMQPMYPAGPIYPLEQSIIYNPDGRSFMHTPNGLVEVLIQPVQTPIVSVPQEIPVQPSQQPQTMDLNIITRAVQEICMETKAKGHSDKNPEDNLEHDAKESSVDLEDYTPPGTPQELSPLSEQQTEHFMITLKNEETKKHMRDEQSKPDKRRKPEQQHYQPPRAARSQAKRTDSWRSNNSSTSNVSEEKGRPLPAQVEYYQEPKREGKEPRSSSSTPTPRASPVPMEQKAETPAVPMIGGIPILPTQTDVKVTTEFCAYCEMRGKSASVITNHSMMSSKGLPACPYLRDEGCKLCGDKGDRAHYFEYCKKKFSKRKNTEFQKLGSYLFSMSTDTRRGIVLKDVGKHPTIDIVTVTDDPDVHRRNSSALKRVVIRQRKWADEDRQKFDENEFIYEHQHHHYDRRDQNQRGRGNSRGAGQYYNNNGSRPRGGSSDRGNRGSRNNRFEGPRRGDRGNRQNYR